MGDGMKCTLTVVAGAATAGCSSKLLVHVCGVVMCVENSSA